jgi:hypothetical protein
LILAAFVRAAFLLKVRSDVWLQTILAWALKLFQEVDAGRILRADFAAA